MTTTSSGRIIAERDGPLGWITFDNPARRNAVSMAMWQELAGQLPGLDEQIRAFNSDTGLGS